MNNSKPNKLDEVVSIYFKAYQQQLAALRSSARWRVGHGVVRLIERLIGRRPRTLALDHMEHMTQAFIQKQQRIRSINTLDFQADDEPHLEELKSSSHTLSNCGIIVSNKNWETAPQGDIFTALELADACTKINGWSCKLIDKNDKKLEEMDVVISMLHEFDVRRIETSKLKIAWIRSYAEFWIMKPWFQQFEIILCSSSKILRFIKLASEKPVFLFPIATNPIRFKLKSSFHQYISDYCFTGNKWGEERRIEKWLHPDRIKYKFKLFGRGWEGHEKLKDYHGGQLGYTDIPSVYSSSTLILDDSNDSTTKWESVNSRVFDVLGMGKMLLTNSTKAVNELFSHPVPTYNSSEELEIKINELLDDPVHHSALFASLQAEVLSHHTYAHRARALNGIFEYLFGQKLNISINISASEFSLVESWGDYHFALGLKKALERWQHKIQINLYADWSDQSFNADVVIVLRGLRAYQPNPAQINILWILSHPEDIQPAELNTYDHVFVASSVFADELKPKTNTPVSTLLQCTDPELFYPASSKDVPSYARLYVANSRAQQRTSVAYARELNLPLDIIGGGWDKIAPREWIKGEYVPNEILRYYYANADMVINDHWPDMRKHGFISNRVFDVLACGANLITDDIPGLSELTDLPFLIFNNESEFEQIIHSATTRSLTQERRQKIHDFSHANSFDRRTTSILDVILALIERRN